MPRLPSRPSNSWCCITSPWRPSDQLEAGGRAVRVPGVPCPGPPNDAPAGFVLQPYCNRASTGPYALDNAILRIG
jgi:hypothetical protein